MNINDFKPFLIEEQSSFINGFDIIRYNIDPKYIIKFNDMDITEIFKKGKSYYFQHWVGYNLIFVWKFDDDTEFYVNENLKVRVYEKKTVLSLDFKKQ